MASPFPGMNPYLENPAFWSEVHSSASILLATNTQFKCMTAYTNVPDII